MSDGNGPRIITRVPIREGERREGQSKKETR